MVNRVHTTIYFTSDKAKDFIDVICRDLAKKEKRSKTYMIENIIMDSVMPPNEKARQIIYENYASEDAVKKLLIEVFNYNAHDIYGQNDHIPYHNNLRPLIKYCYINCSHDYVDPENPSFKSVWKDMHFTSGFRFYSIGVISTIRRRYEERLKLTSGERTLTEMDRLMYSTSIKYAEHILEVIQETPEKLIPHECFELIYDCYDLIKNDSVTYRFLRELVPLSDIKTNAEKRMEVSQLIKEISQEW